MIGAVIAVCCVVAAIVGGFVWFGVALREAERRTADARVDAQNKAGQLAIAAADVATWKKQAARQEERANALDQELETVAGDGDAAGARERVLRRQRAGEASACADPASGGSTEPVLERGPHPAVARPGDTDLAKPGD